MILYSPDRWCSPQSLWFCGRGFAKLRLLCGCSHNKTPGACFCLEVWFKSWQQRSPTTPQGDRHRQKWKSFCICVECDEEDDRLALHKSPVKGRLFCGILLKFCGDKERGASSHVWLRGVFDPEQVVSGTRPALNFPPRRLYLQSGGMCIGWVDQGRFPNPTHTTFQVSWRIWLWLTRRLHFKTYWRRTFYAFKVSESTQALRANIEAIWSDGRSNARGGNGQL